MLFDKRITILTGHSGSGKTNLAINVALACGRRGEAAVLADLDLVNPYFCSIEYAELLKRHGIELIASAFAGSNLDSPALSARLDAVIASKMRLILDVGGDEAGATVLGRYSRAIAQVDDSEMLFVWNGCRMQTQTSLETVSLLRSIEGAARMKADGFVNNTNLGTETTWELLRDSQITAREMARSAGIPLRFTAAAAGLSDLEQLDGPIFPVEIVVRKPWETSFC